MTQTSFQIWAVGRNYADHAREMGHTASPSTSEPMIFLKAGSTAVPSGGKIRLPSWSSDVHHECELALRFGDDLTFSHLTLALDLTARDVQAKLKAAGHPWTLAKSFTDSCPLGAPIPLSRLTPGGLGIADLVFTLKVNGETRQTGRARDMIFPPETLRRYLLERFPVQSGDWLLTGTPAGVARIAPGDRLEAEIEGVLHETWTAVTP